MTSEKEKIIQLLKKYNLSPNFTYGQNFLTDESVLEEMVEVAGVNKKDTVLEIGPGIGNLTRMLCEKAGYVLSVEKDPKFFPILRSVKKDYKENFRFEVADILEFNFSKEIQTRSQSTDKNPNLHISANSESIRKVGPVNYKVVANIPYYITGKILQLFLTAPNRPDSITVLTQKEVAENVVAEVGDLGVLGISVQLFGKPRVVKIVSKKSFFPSPKVDSAVLHIELFKKPIYKIADQRKFFKVVKACFAGKRKQLHNTLVNNLRLEKSEALKILEELKISPSVRPQELSIESWVKLVDKISVLI
ncbi:MAG: ribosomal RNA small subunit methyltransferase A [Candidatus Doudnabacteria bacterium]|nr:ribosomal RNA small subunit methyltransferase A [Candidatus Doudnabacteria bacterium]